MASALSALSDFLGQVAQGMHGVPGVLDRGGSPVDIIAFIAQLAEADFQNLGDQCSGLMSGLRGIDWNQVYFAITGEAPGDDAEGLAQLDAVFQLFDGLCSAASSQMPPRDPGAPPPAPMCEDVLSVPSLPAFMLANLDVGHIQVSLTRSLFVSPCLSLSPSLSNSLSLCLSVSLSLSLTLSLSPSASLAASRPSPAPPPTSSVRGPALSRFWGSAPPASAR